MLESYERLRDSYCADLNGDGRDQLLLLLKVSKSALKKDKLKRSKSSNYTLLSISLEQDPTRQALPAARAIRALDADADGSQELLLWQVKRGVHTIVIPSNNTTVAVPTLRDLSVGTFLNAQGEKQQGLLLHGKDRQLYLLLGDQLEVVLDAESVGRAKLEHDVEISQTKGGRKALKKKAKSIRK